MRRFELVEGTSAKFWQVTISDNDVTTQWGRIGTDGQTKTKTLDNAAAAEAEQTKLINQKTKKGYVEVGSVDDPEPVPAAQETTPDEPVAVDKPTTAPEPRTAPEPEATTDPDASGTPPWLRDGDPVDLDDEFREAAFATRGNPTIQGLRPGQDWGAIAARVRDGYHKDKPNTVPHLQSVLDVCFTEVDPEHLTEEQAVAYLALTRAVHTGTSLTMVVVIERFGFVKAFELLLDSYRIHIANSWSHGKYALSVAEGDDDRGKPFIEQEWVMRAALAMASEQDWAAVVEIADRRWAELPHRRQISVALMLPDHPEFADRAVRFDGERSEYQDWLQGLVTTPELAALAVKGPKPEYNAFGSNRGLVHSYVLERGSESARMLAASADEEFAGEALQRIGTPEAITGLLSVAHRNKEHLGRLQGAVERWPMAAAAALAEAAAGTSRAASLAKSMFSTVLLNHPETAEVKPWLSPAAQTQLSLTQTRLAGGGEKAAVEDLPEVLVSPPWLKKRAKEKVFDLEPLPLEPTEEWPDGARERQLEQVPWRRREDFTSIAEVAQELCSQTYFRNSSDSFIAVQVQMAEALTAGDVDQVVSAYQEYAKVVRAEATWQRETLRGDVLAGTGRAVIDSVRPGFALEVWNALAGIGDDDNDTARVMATWGTAALPGFHKTIRRHPTDEISTAMHFGSVELAPIMARAFLKLKSIREQGLQWLLAHPEHAAAGLIAPALGKKGEALDCARTALQRLALDPKLRTMILATADRYEDPAVTAAVVAVLDQDATDRFPTKIAKRPAWWTPSAWTPIMIGGKALPDEAVDHFGTMLAFPPVDDEPYAGITQVVEQADADSLAEFAWDMFSAWLASGGASKEAWAMTTLGLVGDDETARRITPLLRAWPGESQHKRAVTGLSVLEGIGTDLALMQLNGIATKVKFKALQEAAKEKIQAIAENRGLSTEELADRLAPDLGLAADGTMELDFGPRRFTVGFDEALKPYVRDEEGKRLKDLPKPRQSDDAAPAKEAVAAWKALRKDARAIAAQQVLRLEIAMCTQRRWELAVFEQFLAGHPLVKNLVQRLVWATFADGAAQTFFRVSEDGEYTDAEDEPITLDEDAVVGIPHPLEIPADTAATFGQLFTDYELLPPFEQLARESQSLSAPELSSTKLTRWAGTEIATGKVLGLTNRGWHRGTPADGGVAGYVEKPIGDGHAIVAQLDPGLFTGYLEGAPEQEITEVAIGKAGWWGDVSDPVPFEKVSPIVISEMLRDLDGLT